MKKLILSTNVTMDGFMCGPNGELDWHFEHWNDEMTEYVGPQLASMDTIIAGRVTYESMFGAFGKLDDEFSQMMNSYEKLVLSMTLQTADWNNSRIINENAAEEINRAKQHPGRDMIVWGGVKTVHSLTDMGLIDEYRIWTAPIVLGSGRPFFNISSKRITFNRVDSKAFSNGVILNCYTPK